MDDIKGLFKIDLISMNDTIKASKSRYSYIKAQNVVPKYIDIELEKLITPVQDDEFIISTKNSIKNLEKVNEDNKINLDLEINSQKELLKKYIFGYHLTKSLEVLFQGKTLRERFKIITNTIGLSFERNNIYTLMAELVKYSSITQKNTHLILTGDKEYGKSFPFDSILKDNTDNDFFINKYAGIPTTADLRGSKTEKNKGTAFPLLDREILVFDEISDITKDPDSIPLLKATLESRTYQKFEAKPTPTISSVIMIGNTYFEVDNLEKVSIKDYIPKIISDEALLDRFSAVLIHNKNLFGDRVLATGSKDLGIPAIHLIPILFYLRHSNYSNEPLDKYLKNKVGREHLAVHNISSGLLKILYPEIIPSDFVIEGIVEFATHFRSLTQNEIHNPFSSKSTKFLIEILNEEDKEIDYFVILKNRLFIKLKGKDLCKKIALIDFGTIDNKLEFELSSKHPDCINKVIDKEKNFVNITQEIKAPLATSKKSYINHASAKSNKTFNKLLLESIEYAASIFHSCPTDRFEGVPDFIHNQMKEYLKSKIPQTVLEEYKLKIPSASDIGKTSYAYDQNGIEIINISQYKITK